MRNLVLLLLLGASANMLAVEVPDSILAAILKVESRSYVDADGSIVYVDKSVGSSGEFGPYQMTAIAFKQIYKGNRPRSDIKRDIKFATQLAKRYLQWLHVNFSNGDWTLTVQYYNAGPRNKSPDYLTKIKATLH